jgi:hypothetical chaperone protein
MDAIFGLDFGTTNSALAVNEEGSVRIIDADPFNPNGKTLRSILFFDKTKCVYTGQEAIDHYINDDATGRLMQSIKTFLTSKTFDTTNINRKLYQLDDLISIILQTLKKRGENDLGREVSSVVLGRPIIFSENSEIDRLAEQRLKSAAIKAGFKDIFFQFEPVAAALAFESLLEQGEEKIVLVGDFGGGTSDFTVIRLRGKNLNVRDRKTDILSLGGVYIGGDTFDSQIMWHRMTHYFGINSRFRDMRDQWLEVPQHVYNKLCKWHLIPQLRDSRQREFFRQIKARSDDPDAIARLDDLIYQNYGFRLFQAIEKTKCELSTMPTSRVVFHESLTNINTDITKIEFEDMIGDGLVKINHCIEETIRNSGLTSDKIDTVFITGGSSHVPCIKKIFETEFGKEKIRTSDAFTSVVYGLGLTASNL